MDGIFKDLKDFYYLGVILSSTVIIFQPHITTKIKELSEKLETLKELQSLLGLLNYGRQFVKNLSKWEKLFLEKLKNAQKN
ncbi:DNA-directed DNA polymerase [Handroanthus impetiginosus]|uniref:DNA-directed DNA polymerase n=1 Tax=Handroanthus impetiginosus TaxID=429701 RepID=A0A2G9HVI3_9LAMI|nr:DNA-directed DNA polymerase [Handroanthus impetiginosus]